MADQALSERWQKAKVASQVAAILLMPLILALVGHTLSSALKEREARTRFIELAISILREEPRSEYEPIRKWALEVVDRYSEIKIEGSVRTALLSELALPRSKSSVIEAESFHFPVGSEVSFSQLRGSVRLQAINDDGSARVSIKPWSKTDIILGEVGDTEIFNSLGRKWIVMLESINQTDQTAMVMIFRIPKPYLTVVEDPVFE